MKTFKTFLTEARGRIYAHIPRSGEFLSVGRGSGSRRQFPGYVVDIRDKESSKVPVYIIRVNVLKKKTAEKGMNNPDYGTFMSLGGMLTFDNYIVREDVFTTLEDFITRNGAGKKVMMDRIKLAQELVVKLDVSKYYVREALGDVDISSETGTRIGNTKVTFVAGISPKKQKSVLDGIEAAKMFTKPFPKVFRWFDNTEFFVMNKPIPGAGKNVPGVYHPTEDRIDISTANIRSETTFVAVILHELMHRIDHKGNIDSASYTTKHRNLPIRSDVARGLSKMAADVLVSVAEKSEEMKVRMNGREYYVIGMEDDKKNLRVMDAKKSGIYLLDIDNIMDYRQDIEFELDGHPWEDFPEDVKTMAKMFPSYYSTEGKADEWFAEIGAASMMHKIDGDIADWFKEEIETASEPPQSPQDGS